MSLEFDKLVEIITKLRDPVAGCPWDIKQTSASLIPNMIEEIYEAVEAIENQNHVNLCEELGDILLHVVFQVQLATEQKHFNMNDVLNRVNEKLVRRHPHVFGESTINNPNAEQVKQNWELIKLAEKDSTRESVLGGVPLSMPALIVAHRMQEKAAHVGFDWPDIEPVFEKIYEEISEVRDEIARSVAVPSDTIYANNELQKANLELEIGDLLFSVVNLARKLNIDSETALRRANDKFKNRFQKLELLTIEKNINMSEVGLEKLDELWELIKKD
jgi:MazG family protein